MLDGKLGKLTFIFYPDPKLPGVGIPFPVQYNPTTLNINHSVSHDLTDITPKGAMPKFLSSNPRTVSLELLFDGTGASPSSLESITSLASDAGIPTVGDIKRVDVQVQLFLKLAYQIGSEEHGPLYIMMVWGTFVMTCKLDSASVNYTMFDSDGTPLRARLSISVTEYIDDSLIGKILNLSSPDLSKSVTIVEGDSLQLLCHKIYGNAALYTQVAAVNKLDNYRKLKPGSQLLFPPLTTSFN
ncbi:MAG TPA: hypothetical protein VK177_01700 [Flavobacteriales bacterium]|nr:hypothetical protein [Flavobacteriales bacterium]